MSDTRVAFGMGVALGAALCGILTWVLLGWLYSYRIDGLMTVIAMKDARIDACEYRNRAADDRGGR